MKKRLYIFFALVAMVTTSCQREIETIHGFETDLAAIEAEAHGGEFRVSIRSEKEWTAVTDVPWIMVSPANGRGEVRCVVKIDSTLINDSRSTSIRFSSEGQALDILEVVQQGYAKMIEPSSDVVTIKASAPRTERNFEVEINTNVEFDIKADYGQDEEWLKVYDYSLTLDRGARPRKTVLSIDWKMNSVPEAREATLRLCTKSGDELSKICVHQAAAPLIEDSRAGDSLAIVTIYEKLNCWAESTISTTESMNHWEAIRLWEASDRTLPCKEAIGRVRDLDLSYFNTEDDLPVEFKYLKYLETLSLYGNVNTMIKDIHICEELCDLEYLKALRIGAFGLVELPESFVKLGDTLETLDLNSNNFVEIPAILTQENFPQLRSLDLSSNRRHIIADLRSATSFDKGVGMHDKGERLRKLFMWENLEELLLSYNYLEGGIPEFEPGVDGVRAYSAEDVRERGDSINWAVERGLPYILPNMRRLMINLNYFTGNIPDWLLYHPRLLEWSPENLIYVQQEKGVDSNGRAVGFSNQPTSREYYFEKYPLLRDRFEFNDVIEE
jgi:hypothetical protein